MGDGRCRCCCISYRTRVTLFAFTNVVRSGSLLWSSPSSLTFSAFFQFLAGVQLILPLISSGFILYFTGSKKEFEAKYVLHHETISLFERIPKIVLRPPDSSQISVEYVGKWREGVVNWSRNANGFSFSNAGMPHSQLQSDLHVWSSWIFMKVVILVYSALLYTGARKVTLTTKDLLVGFLMILIPGNSLSFFTEKLRSSPELVCPPGPAHPPLPPPPRHGLWPRAHEDEAPQVPGLPGRPRRLQPPGPPLCVFLPAGSAERKGRGSAGRRRKAGRAFGVGRGEVP